MSTHKIPAGAIKINLRNVQQNDNFSCGPGSAMAVFAWCGVGPETLNEYRKALKTTSDHGTPSQEIVRYALALGLDATVHNGMTRAQLKQYLDEATPVILSFQAYAADSKVYDDSAINDDGHYAVAIGYDADDFFYFMDPSICGKPGFLSWEDLNKRWHDREASNELSHHLGLVIKPKHPRTELARKID
ncbi:MAG: C39 family peptidase [Candidatus Obscuribacterales bacterium]|nr:C39 family peptidase [Candidatus Obscuribacterales bacterium]